MIDPVVAHCCIQVRFIRHRFDYIDYSSVTIGLITCSLISSGVVCRYGVWHHYGLVYKQTYVGVGGIIELRHKAFGL